MFRRHFSLGIREKPYESILFLCGGEVLSGNEPDIGNICFSDKTQAREIAIWLYFYGSLEKKRWMIVPCSGIEPIQKKTCCAFRYRSTRRNSSSSWDRGGKKEGWWFFDDLAWKCEMWRGANGGCGSGSHMFVSGLWRDTLSFSSLFHLPWSPLLPDMETGPCGYYSAIFSFITVTCLGHIRLSPRPQ